MFQRILLAWDGSPVALSAFDVSIDIARRYQAELRAVSIAYTPAHAETRADREETADAAHRYLAQTLEDVIDRAVRVGVEVRHEIIDGENPVQALLGYCHDHGFDLIVCGHHHDRRAGRLLLRGVAQDLIQTATTPVLVIGRA